MIIDQPYYYFKFYEELEDRMDFRYYHPFFDEFYIFINKFGTKINENNLIKFMCNGSTPPTLPTEDTLNSDKVLHIKNKNVKPLKLDLKNKYYIFRSDFENSHKNLHISKNDILLTMTGTLGNACIINEDIEASINQNVVILRFNEDVFDLEYVVRFLNSDLTSLQILRNYTSAQTPYLNGDKLKNLRIIVLPKPIQQKIMEEVLKVESKAINSELKAKKSFLKINNIFLDYLNIDLEEVSYSFKKSKLYSDYYYIFNEDIKDRMDYTFNHPKIEILEKLKNKYKTVLLKNISRKPIIRGEQPKYKDIGVRVIKTVDLKNHFIDYENALKVSEEFYKSKSQAHIQKGDILISSTGYGSLGKIDVYDLDDPALVDSHISIVRLNNDYDPYFVTYFLRSTLGQIQFEKWFTGSSGQIEVQPSDLGNFLIPSKEDISLEKQREIAYKITNEYEKALKYELDAQNKWNESKELFEKLIHQHSKNI